MTEGLEFVVVVGFPPYTDFGEFQGSWISPPVVKFIRERRNQQSNKLLFILSVCLCLCVCLSLLSSEHFVFSPRKERSGRALMGVREWCMASSYVCG